MTVFACPVCDRPAPAAGCDACGRGPEPLLTRLGELDAAVETRERENRALRSQLDAGVARLTELHGERRQVLADLSTRAAQLRHARSTWTVPAEQPTGEPAPSGVAVSAPIPTPAPPPHVPAAAPGPVPPESSTRSIQNVLLGLGGVLSVAAVVIFTAVAWVTYGANVRAAILVVLTAGLLAAPPPLVRRGLHATAEALSGLGLLMTPCTLIALYYLDVFSFASADAPATVEQLRVAEVVREGIVHPVVLFGGLGVTVVALAYRLLSGMITPGAIVVVFGAATLGLGVAQPTPDLGLAALLPLSALLACCAIMFGRRPARRGRHSNLLLPHAAAGVAAATLIVSSVYAAAHFAESYVLLAAAVAVAGLLAVAPAAPGVWRLGAVVASGAGAVVTWLAAASQALYLAGASIASTAPIWAAEATPTARPGAWQAAAA
ncbi:MAG: hypothetical protein ACRDXX_17850, partial [Stackebrandtia sp.]